MQQQNDNKSNINVHVKVEYNEEYRRFVVETLSFTHLEQTLRSLLNISPAQHLKILFLDDEKDWVLMESDSELGYAWELSPSLLRLSVKPATPARVALPATACTEAFAQFPTRGCWRGRGGCHGRGGRGGRGGCDPATRIQFLDSKLARLTERQAMLNAKIPGMPEDKARAVSWRLAHLENKIANIKWKKEHFQAQVAEHLPQPEVTETVQDEPAKAAEPVAAWEGRGCGGRRGPGRCPRWAPEPNNHPLKENLILRREELKAARQGGNKEDIQAKWEALQQAKFNWKEAHHALMAERHHAK